MKNRIRKSAFDLTHEKQLTARSHGELYPILCEAVLPGDNFRCKSEILARVVPLINPIYQRFDIYTHFYYVPNRLLWKNWEKFISPENANPVPPVFPSFKLGNADDFANGVINCENLNSGFWSYLNGRVEKTVGDPTTVDMSILPFRAYTKIWNEYYRDVDLQNERLEYDSDGVTQNELSEMSALHTASSGFLVRNYEKDYFTSARPWAQKGNPVTVGVQGTAYIQEQINPATDNPALIDVNHAYPSLGALSGGGLNGIQKTTGNQRLWIQPNGTLYADMERAGEFATTETPNISIEDIRYANTMQKFLEKVMRFGSKYHETLKSVFGVTVPDYRVARPEYIGGGRQPLVISEVLQQSQSETTPLGTFGGHGISSGQAGFNYTFAEHGYVIGLMSIMPRPKYLNGIRKEYMKSDRFDFATPDFANLGEQKVMNVELNGKIHAQSEIEFGYQERYAEYKFIPSTVHGAFATDNILKTFHCARELQYALNAEFLTPASDVNQINRIYAVDDYDPFLITMINNIVAIRPLPRHSNPALAL